MNCVVKIKNTSYLIIEITLQGDEVLTTVTIHVYDVFNVGDDFGKGIVI